MSVSMSKRWNAHPAETSRMVTVSSLGFNAGDTNLYRYVGNDPTTDTDPSGLMALPVWLKLWAAWGSTPPRPQMPQGAPAWGRGTVKWGTGAKDAAKRASEITCDEARALDRQMVQRVRNWYIEVYRNNPNNLTALERVKLMQRILTLQRNHFFDFIVY